jgi:hypothetical protein
MEYSSDMKITCVNPFNCSHGNRTPFFLLQAAKEQRILKSFLFYFLYLALQFLLFLKPCLQIPELIDATTFAPESPACALGPLFTLV